MEKICKKILYLIEWIIYILLISINCCFLIIFHTLEFIPFLSFLSKKIKQYGCFLSNAINIYFFYIINNYTVIIKKILIIYF